MKKRDAFFFPLLLLLLVPFTAAETPGSQNQLKADQLNLIPAPKEVRLQQGGFRVKPTTRILVEFGHQEEDRIAAETLAEEIHDQSGFKVSITGSKEKAQRECEAPSC